MGSRGSVTEKVALGQRPGGLRELGERLGAGGLRSNREGPWAAVKSLAWGDVAGTGQASREEGKSRPGRALALSE